MCGPRFRGSSSKVDVMAKKDALVQVVAGEAWATVSDGWDGAIRVALLIANFGRRERRLADVRLRHVRVGPTHLGDNRALLGERNQVIPARGVARAFLDLRMGADDVSRLRRGFEPAANRASSPKVDMECAGDLVLARRIGSRDVPFLLKHLAVAWTVADQGLGG